MMIAAIFVTYNPNSQFERNLNAIRDQVDHVFVVDNGSQNGSLSFLRKCTKRITNTTLIENGDNYGIAKALNIACMHAYDLNYMRVLLLDQDSLVSDRMVEYLQSSMDFLPDAAVVGPRICPKGEDFNAIGFEAKYILPKSSLLPVRASVSGKPLRVLFNITSGSLLCLNAFNSIGNFNESLFIEGVDNEFGLRANKIGYSIYIDNKAFLNQEYGESQVRSLFGVKFFPTNHSPLRHYYVSRNRMYIWKEYYKNYPSYLVWDLIATTKVIFNIVMFESDKYRKLKNMLIGAVHGIRGKYGKA